MTKKELRNIYLPKRRELDGRQQAQWDDLLLIKIQQMDTSSVSVLFTYFPVDANKEPNTIACTNYLRYMIPELIVAYPVCNFENNTMQAVITTEDTVYKAGKYGIMQPSEGYILDPWQIDLVFVPMIICDKQGYRVGYGKGFYDRFLSQCRNDIQIWGFTYFEPVDKITDTHQYDIPLTHCITPYNIYEF